MDRKALWYMLLLAIQFGVQPILTDIPKSAVIFVQECVKFAMAWAMLRFSSTKGMSHALQHWSMMSWLQVAMVPAALYAVQNVLALRAYQHLDPLTFNVLNQTKTLSAALCCYWILGSRQSKMQVMALLLLLGSALVMEQIVTWQGIIQTLELISHPEHLQSWFISSTGKSGRNLKLVIIHFSVGNSRLFLKGTLAVSYGYQKSSSVL